MVKYMYICRFVELLDNNNLLDVFFVVVVVAMYGMVWTIQRNIAFCVAKCFVCRKKKELNP